MLKLLNLKKKVYEYKNKCVEEEKLKLQSKIDNMDQDYELYNIYKTLLDNYESLNELSESDKTLGKIPWVILF